MAKDIHTTFSATVKVGKIEEFKRLIEEMGKPVEKNQSGARRHHFYMNNDQTQCVVNESYAGLEAIDAHVKGVASQTILLKFLKLIK